MGPDLYLTLAWLEKPPLDFRQRCRALLESSDAPGPALLRLAAYGLDENQLQRLANVIETIRRQGRSLAPLAQFKLGIVGNATLEPIVPALIASAARHRIALECVRADFAQTVQEAISPESQINRSQPDAVLIALDYRGLPLVPGSFDDDAACATVNTALSFLETVRKSFRANTNAPCILQTIAPPPEALFGNFDRAVAGTLRRLTATFNAALVERVTQTHDLLFDVAAIAETVGLANWFSPTQWNVGKFAFDAKFLPLYADHLARLLAVFRGKSRKCLILDLDNTVWGGVIGDDGLEGIVIGQGDATGEAYLDVQRAALALRDRGVVLAVSSKNDDDIARAAFIGHPEMLLRENHIAVFQANWDNKATNIAAIASELSLGLDAVVFLDDNPAERGLIRDQLPEVAVPELPDNPALYARTLCAAGYFDTVSFSDEDRARADFYAANARRVTLQGQVGNLDDYLASLKMEISFKPFDAGGRGRITQLVNKSNQFNLTTRRYNEIDIAAFESDPAVFTLQVRLSDAFGDNGMISVVICRARSPDEWEIDTWLMSCRVLGRGVEQTVLRELAEHARARGVRRLIGLYVPTEKNRLVSDHYHKLGFRLLSEGSSGATTWEFSTETTIPAAPMAVHRAGFEFSAV